jgi:hypothetical protein
MAFLTPDIPTHVRWALGLALASVGTGLINSARHWPTAFATLAPGVAVVVMAIAMFMTALWLGLLYLVATRRNWARIIFIVSAFLAVPGAVLTVMTSSAADPVTAVVAIGQHGSHLCAGVLLLLPHSSRWFKTGPVR